MFGMRHCEPSVTGPAGGAGGAISAADSADGTAWAAAT